MFVFLNKSRFVSSIITPLGFTSSVDKEISDSVRYYSPL